MSTSTAPGLHRATTSSAVTRCGRLGSRNQHRAHNEIGGQHRVARSPSEELITVWIRPCQIRSMSRRRLDRSVDDRDLGLHAGGDLGGVGAGHARAEHHDLGGRDPGGAAHQDAASSARSFQRCGALLRCHPPGDLGHRRQERKPAVGRLDGLVRDRSHLAVDEEPGERLIGRQVQVGEQHLAAPEPFVLLGLRLLHLHDHVGLAEHGVGIRRDLAPRPREVLVGDRGAQARGRLHHDTVAGSDQLAHPFGGQRHPVLVVLDFLRDSDDHVRASWTFRHGRHVASEASLLNPCTACRHGIGSDGRPGANSSARAVMPSRTRPPRAAAIMSCSGAVVTSIPSSAESLGLGRNAGPEQVHVLSERTRPTGSSRPGTRCAECR